METWQIRELFEQGKYKEIVEFFIKNPPSSSDEYNLLALSYYNLGFFDESEEVLKNGLTVFPNDVDILFNLIEILYGREKYDEVEEYLDTVLSIEPDNYVYYDILATINLKKGQNEKAYKAAKKALKFSPSDVSKDLAEKYHQFWNDLSVPFWSISNNKKSKNLLLVSSGCNYPHSFRKFVENGWGLYVLRTQTWKAFEPNYGLLESIGARIIDKDEIEEFIEEMGANIDLVVRTGYFYGANDLHRFARVCDIDPLDSFFKVSAKIRKKNKNLKTILAFDGDSFFNDERWNNWLVKRIKDCDYVLFDTKNLRDYFISRINSKVGFDDERLKVLRVEMPCSDDIMIEEFPNYVRKVLTMGRTIRSYMPIGALFIEEMKEQINIGRGKDYDELEAGKRRFLEKYGNYGFGLGYFYDFYDRQKSFGELIDENDDDNISSNSMSYIYPGIYGYTNVPGKVITYLQFGLVPVIPNDENDFHRELIDNGMAIGMDRRNLFFNPYSYSDKVISEMRRNIAMNRDIFTFDLFYDFVENLVERREK